MIAVPDSALRVVIRAGQAATRWAYSRLAVPTWTSKDGRTVPLPQMTDEHLQNAIRVVQRRGEDPAGPPILAHLQREWSRRQRGGFR